MIDFYYNELTGLQKDSGDIRNLKTLKPTNLAFRFN